MKKKYILTTAIYGTAMIIMPATSHSRITSVTTTTHNYDFPDSAPIVISTTRTTHDCPPTYYDGSSNDGGGRDASGFGGDDNGGYGSNPGDGSGGGGGKVLCTYFYLKGMIPADIYMADRMYESVKVTNNIRNGYHLWAVPLVKLLQTGQHPYLEKILYIGVQGWAYEMAYVMGISNTHHPLGRILRIIGEPLCAMIGRASTPKNYKALWLS